MPAYGPLLLTSLVAFLVLFVEDAAACRVRCILHVVELSGTLSPCGFFSCMERQCACHCSERMSSQRWSSPLLELKGRLTAADKIAVYVKADYESRLAESNGRTLLGMI